MANQTINVRTWSKQVPAYGLALGDLDLYVLKNHDEILRALGRQRVTDSATTRRLLRAVAIVVLMMAPITGVSTLGGAGRFGDGLDDSLGVPVTAWAFAVAVVGVVVVAVRWLRSDRHAAPVEIVYLAGTIVCGGLALLQLETVRGVDIAAFAVPSLPVWVASAAAAIILAAIVLGSRGRRVPIPDHFRTIGTPDQRTAAELIDALDPREREKLLDDRRRAIRRLRERGLIGADDATQLESVPLGESTSIG
ncbi:hypothetical protein [Ruania alba]|uniref:Uncharacterized protein n=1 Tax=Ruania alba TaxID=648782 RepID=A0A1H5CSA8_9MICO|nr:hypothetical protein [Ruania alba]SED69330.1 hypothetical protein SAMN04488554_0451 [Ruania alba]